MEEPRPQQLVYITNLKNGLQKDGIKLYDEEGPNQKKPTAENRLVEEVPLNNFNHIFELYEESGSDNDHMKDSLKGENKKNLKEIDYTNMDEKKEGKQADLQNKKKIMVSS